MGSGQGNGGDGGSGTPGEVDRSLVERFARGDRAAFDEIMAAYRPPVARLVHRLLAWPSDVDDVVQDVFVAALRNLRKFDHRSSLVTWLYAIAVNECRSHRRRRLLRRMFGGPPAAEPASPADPPDRRTMDRETHRRVRRAVRGLPQRYREVAVLRYLHEMPIEQIAQVLRVSRNVVQVRLHRARGRLRTLLSGLVEEEP